MRTVMVTGVGAVIGYGLLRSLQSTKPDMFLVGADMYPDAVGRAWCDAFEQPPMTSDPYYAGWLQNVLSERHVDLLIPGIEQDVHWLSDNRQLMSRFPCKVVLNTHRLINLSRDKWTMHQELESIGDVSRIPSRVTGSFDSLSSAFGLPFLLKPRRSYASKGLVRIERREEFDVHSERLGKELLAQPIIGAKDEEFTVGVFGDGLGGVCASISMRRKLAPDGSTAKAWINADTNLDKSVARLCEHFKPLGPTNLQFRRDANGEWKLLEINPRISSSSSIRRAFGYNNQRCVSVFISME